jgi:hypothetical protein
VAYQLTHGGQARGDQLVGAAVVCGGEQRDELAEGQRALAAGQQRGGR